MDFGILKHSLSLILISETDMMKHMIRCFTINRGSSLLWKNMLSVEGTSNLIYSNQPTLRASWTITPKSIIKHH